MYDRVSPAKLLLRRLLSAIALFLVAFAIIGGLSAMFGADAPGLSAQEGSGAAAPAARMIIPVDGPGSTIGERLVSFVGIFGLLAIAWGLSRDRRSINWKLVAIGIGLQLFFAVIVLKTWVGRAVFDGVTDVFNRLLGFTADGAAMLFWGQPTLSATFAFGILPTIIFFSSLMTVLYHIGAMQVVVKGVAWAMRRTMGTSGSETLSAAANIFVGQTEAPLMVKPYISTMTKSELMAVMTGGFATVAGGVMAAYIGMLSRYFPDIAGHLLAASVMSAPAALVIAKIMYPETEDSPTRGEVKMEFERPDANVIDAAARGASEGMMLAINVAAMLLAFVALVSMFNFAMAVPSYMQHLSALKSVLAQAAAAGFAVPAELAGRCDPAMVSAEGRVACIEEIRTAWGAAAPAITTFPVVKLQTIFGVLFWPIALLMGTPIEDCYAVAKLLGTKTVLNEFVAYTELATMLETEPLQPRSVIIASYALCGFANFGSIAIQIGGIGSIAPERRRDLAQIGFSAMVAGSLAAFLTAAVVGVLI
jgi:CNT family concentrative nucleoside transporter